MVRIWENNRTDEAVLVTPTHGWLLFTEARRRSMLDHCSVNGLTLLGRHATPKSILTHSQLFPKERNYHQKEKGKSSFEAVYLKMSSVKCRPFSVEQLDVSREKHPELENRVEFVWHQAYSSGENDVQGVYVTDVLTWYDESILTRWSDSMVACYFKSGSPNKE